MFPQPSTKIDKKEDTKDVVIPALGEATATPCRDSQLLQPYPLPLCSTIASHQRDIGFTSLKQVKNTLGDDRENI